MGFLLIYAQLHSKKDYSSLTEYTEYISMKKYKQEIQAWAHY